MLTKRQADCHVFIARWMETNHEAPSYEEIITGLSLRSKSEVHRLLVALEERGFIRRLKNRARAIELLRQPGAPALAGLETAG